MVEKVTAMIREHNYHPNTMTAGLRAGCTRSARLMILDFENTSYTRIANYLECQARQRGYQLLTVCSEDQPDGEMYYIEYLLRRQTDAITVSTSLLPEHPFYQRWINSSSPTVTLDRALDCEHLTNAVGMDQDDTEMPIEELRKFPVETVLYLSALPELFINFPRGQGFRTAWKDGPHEAHFLYANSYEREVATQSFDKWLETHPMPQTLFTMPFALLQGVVDVTLHHDRQLPSDLAIATFGNHELLDSLQCLVLAVVQRHRNVVERVLEITLASLDGPRKPRPGLAHIRRNLYRRDVPSCGQVSPIGDVDGISL